MVERSMVVRVKEGGLAGVNKGNYAVRHYEVDTHHYACVQSHRTYDTKREA